MDEDTGGMRGVQVVRAGQLSSATAQTQGMLREVAVAPETTGSRGIWMGIASTPGGTVNDWHHHGDCETAIYVLAGRARFRWGPGGRASAEVGPGDFLAVAPGAIHQEEALGKEPVVFVVARACSSITVVNVAGPAPVA